MTCSLTSSMSTTWGTCGTAPGSASAAARQPGRGAGAATLSRPSASLEGYDVVQFSGAGSLLAGQPLLLPTAANMQKLSAALSSQLGDALRGAGISPEPPVDLAVDWQDGSIRVTGSRPDASRIAELVNGDPELKRQVRTLSAISSHACAMPEQMKFQAEYRASQNPEAVVAKYASLFGRQRARAISLRLDGQGVQVMVDGKAWPAAEQG